MRVDRPAYRWGLTATGLMLVFMLAACGEAATSSKRGTSERPAPGARATFDGVPYVAVEAVPLSLLRRDRLEQWGDARLPRVRHVPAYRLRLVPRVAVRFTADGDDGWLAWHPAAVYWARLDLIRRTGADPAHVQTVDVLSESWLDGCLGVSHGAASCAPEPTGGFRAMLRWGGRTYEYHTDQRDRAVRLEN